MSRVSDEIVERAQANMRHNKHVQQTTLRAAWIIEVGPHTCPNPRCQENHTGRVGLSIHEELGPGRAYLGVARVGRPSLTVGPNGVEVDNGVDESSVILNLDQLVALRDDMNDVIATLQGSDG